MSAARPARPWATEVAADRDPPATGPARLAPIATLPLFFKLRGRHVVLAGGGAPAAWKAELLSAAGAAVAVYAPDPSPDMLAVAASPPDGAITVHPRHWTPADLDCAALALGDCESEAEASAFQAAAQRAGVPVNVIDKPGFCDFQFGTVVSRSPLLVGISTDGAAPVLGQAIRTRIEALLPAGLAEWAAAARAWRPAFQARTPDFRQRRRFWSAFADRALAGPDRAPTEVDRAACLAAAFATPEAAALQVVLVGAGRGSTDCITLAAVKALQNADVIVYGADIAPALVGLGRREALRIALPEGRTPEDGAASVCEGRAGLVAWLDKGDPARCARWQARFHALTGRGASITMVEGLGRCAGCGPACPAWTDEGSGQASSLAG